MVEPWHRRADKVKTFFVGIKCRPELTWGLLYYPRVLFFIEHTLGLDPQTWSCLWHFILCLREKEGITIFLTTHYIDEAWYADHIAIMDYEKIINLETPDNLRSSQDLCQALNLWH